MSNLKLVIPDISVQQNWHRTFLRRSEIVQIRICAGQNGHRSKLTQVRIGTGQDWRRLESAQKKNKLTLLYFALTKIKFIWKVNSFVFIGNLLCLERDCIFLRCHYAYLSIIITNKLSVLNHNKI